MSFNLDIVTGSSVNVERPILTPLGGVGLYGPSPGSEDDTDTSPDADDVPFDGPSVGDGEIDPKATQAEEGVSTESDTAAVTTKKGK